MVLGIQILGFLFGLLMVYITFLNYKRREFTIKEYLFWVILWALFISVALAPGILDFVVKDILNLSRTMDFFVIIGFMFIIAAVFYTYTIVRRNQKKLENIVRRMAIDRGKK